MSKGIDIRDLAALKSLKTVLRQVSERGLNLISPLDNGLKKEFENFKRIERQKQQEVGQCQAKLQSYHAALSRCENSGYYDREGHYQAPNCRELRDSVAYCHKELREAEKAYHDCVKIVAGVKAAIEKFNKSKVKLKHLLQNHTPPAAQALQQLIDGAENYQGLQAHTGSSSGSAGGTVAKEGSGEGGGNPIGQILMAVTGASAIAILAHETVQSSAGESYELHASAEGGQVSFYAKQGDASQRSARLTIREGGGKKVGKMLNFKVRDSELKTKILRNIEQTAKKNRCTELNAWASQDEVAFFEKHQYCARHATPAGAEMYKDL